MDPELWELLAAGEEEDEVAAIVRLSDTRTVPDYTRIITQFGHIATVRMARRHIVDVRNSEDVTSLKAARRVGPELELPVDESLRETAYEELFDRRRPDDLDVHGRGCVVGIVDWGMDFAAPAFRDDNGRTRLLALWDQRRPRSGAGNRYGYGTIHMAEAINQALATDDAYAALDYYPFDSDPLDDGTHGAHVAGIAAGSALPDGPSGLADLADIVFVHLASWGTSGLADLGDSVTILEAIDFILQTAGAKPCVINMSVGRTGGQHDGLSLVEQGLDAAVSEKPGRCIVQSTGNYYMHLTHTAGQLLPDARHDLHFRVDPADMTLNEIEIWYPGRDEILVELSSPGGEITRQVRVGEDVAVEQDGRKLVHIYHRRDDPTNRKNHVDAFLFPGAPSGDWTLSLIGENVVNGQYDAWIERDEACPGCQPKFPPQEAVSLSTTGTICNGFETIAVGAYDVRSPVLSLAPFSSSGPTLDGRPKPNLIAPGVAVLSTRSTPRGARPGSGGLRRSSGTSMAAPSVTGTVALMFEAAGRPLYIHETRRLLLGSADAVTAPGEAAHRVGNGRLNVARAVEHTRRYAPARRPRETIEEQPMSTIDTSENKREKGDEAATIGETVAAVETPPETSAEEPADFDDESPPTVEVNGEMDSAPEGSGTSDEPLEVPVENQASERNPWVEADEEPDDGYVGEDWLEGEEEESEPAALPDWQGTAAEAAASPEWFDPGAEAGHGESYGRQLQSAPAGHSTMLSAVAEAVLLLLEADANPLAALLAAVSGESAESFAQVTPTELFTNLVYGGPESARLHDLFEVVAYPRDLLTQELRAGDILLRRAGGRRTHVAVLASGEQLTLGDLYHVRGRSESTRSGRYIQVIEGGDYPHGTADRFYRRITDAREETPRSQLILRLAALPGMEAYGVEYESASFAADLPEAGFIEMRERPSLPFEGDLGFPPDLFTPEELDAGEAVHSCRPGEGPPAQLPDPAGKGLHPLVQRGAGATRSRNPTVGDAQILLNRFLKILDSKPAVLVDRSPGATRDVNRWRARLRAIGEEPLTVDCRFGEGTQLTVRMFQRSMGLSPDGKIGPLTWMQLVRFRGPLLPVRTCGAGVVGGPSPLAPAVASAGHKDFDAGTITVGGRTMRVKGSVFYPAKSAGLDAPFSDSKALQDPLPIVFIAHGNHAVFHDPANRGKERCCLKPGDAVFRPGDDPFDPRVCISPRSYGWTEIMNHSGYRYWQEQLARLGIIAVSINCNETNCPSSGSSASNIHLRGDFILKAIQHFQTLNGADPTFRGKIDLARVGLMGHSRGGEAVLVAAEKMGFKVPGVIVRGVISLAPTNNGASSGRPSGFPYMVILPAADGDVITNEGAQFYDQAAAAPFKTQLYIDKTNHNFFNREWVNDEGHGAGRLAQAEHEGILSFYGCAFFRQALLDHDFITLLCGHHYPSATALANVHISAELGPSFTVDDHENRDARLNKLGRPTRPSAHLTIGEHDFAQGGPSLFNLSFFGETVGLVAESSRTNETLRQELKDPVDVRGREIWIRTAEVYEGSPIPAAAMNFHLGLEDDRGRKAFADAAAAGGIPRPFDRRTDDLGRFGVDLTKTMLTTLQFPAACFTGSLNLRRIKAIEIRFDGPINRPLAFDQLQLV